MESMPTTHNVPSATNVIICMLEPAYGSLPVCFPIMPNKTLCFLMPRLAQYRQPPLDEFYGQLNATVMLDAMTPFT
jgi:hypothetical protein